MLPPDPPPTSALPRLLAMMRTAALGLFVLITVAMATGLFRLFDPWLLTAFRTNDPSVALGGRAVLQAMRDISALGGVLVLSLVTIVSAAALARCGKAPLALFLILSNALAEAASWGLKHAFARPRPEVVPHLAEAFSASYPSGHALMSAAVWLTLAGIVASLTPRNGAWIAPVAALLLVAVIGLSRIYLGVHWPSDVFGGWAFGSFWALSSLGLGRRLRLL